jgi:hypothetical protein
VDPIGGDDRRRGGVGARARADRRGGAGRGALRRRPRLYGRAAAPAPPEIASPGLTAYLYAAGSLALAVAVAGVALARVPALPGPLRTVVDALRAVHNGRPGDYVAWTVAGAATLGGVFAVALL